MKIKKIITTLLRARSRGLGHESGLFPVDAVEDNTFKKGDTIKTEGRRYPMGMCTLVYPADLMIVKSVDSATQLTARYCRWYDFLWYLVKNPGKIVAELRPFFRPYHVQNE